MYNFFFGILVPNKALDREMRGSQEETRLLPFSGTRDRLIIMTKIILS